MNCPRFSHVVLFHLQNRVVRDYQIGYAATKDGKNYHRQKTIQKALTHLSNFTLKLTSVSDERPEQQMYREQNQVPKEPQQIHIDR